MRTTCTAPKLHSLLSHKTLHPRKRQLLQEHFDAQDCHASERFNQKNILTGEPAACAMELCCTLVSIRVCYLARTEIVWGVGNWILDVWECCKLHHCRAFLQGSTFSFAQTAAHMNGWHRGSTAELRIAVGLSEAALRSPLRELRKGLKDSVA